CFQASGPAKPGRAEDQRSEHDRSADGVEKSRGSAALREQLMHVTSLAELDAALAGCDPDEPFPPDALRAVRGKRGRLPRVVLPDGYLDSLDDDHPPGPEAEQLSSGG